MNSQLKNKQDEKFDFLTEKAKRINQNIHHLFSGKPYASKLKPNKQKSYSLLKKISLANETEILNILNNSISEDMSNTQKTSEVFRVYEKNELNKKMLNPTTNIDFAKSYFMFCDTCKTTLNNFVFLECLTLNEKNEIINIDPVHSFNKKNNSCT